MDTLFPLDPILPEGFLYYPDFLSFEEENELINYIRRIPLHNLVFQGYTANRKVESFGYDYSFESRRATKGKEIPAEFMPIIAKAGTALKIDPAEFEEILLTEYPPGSVINWHRDGQPFDRIAGISLGSDCSFRLRPYDKTGRNRKSTVTVTAERRSLYLISGEARSEWEHSTVPVQTTRYSITLRTLRK